MTSNPSIGFFYLNDTELSIVWAFAQRKRHCPHFEDTELGGRIATSMRARFPIPGWSWDKFLTVYLKPGELIQPHHHKRHAVLWYPRETTVLISKQEQRCADGELIYLPPFTVHEVPRVTVERLSVAMLVSEPVAT